MGAKERGGPSHQAEELGTLTCRAGSVPEGFEQRRSHVPRAVF